MSVTTSDDVAAEIVKRCAMLDDAINDLASQSRKAALADHEYRKAKAAAYLASSGTIPEREAHVIQGTADLRYRAKEAEDLRQAALEAVRSRRAQLSAAQSVANAVKAEAELAGKGPEWSAGQRRAAR